MPLCKLAVKWYGEHALCVELALGNPPPLVLCAAAMETPCSDPRPQRTQLNFSLTACQIHHCG